jgi:hypothetical protein
LENKGEIVEFRNLESKGEIVEFEESKTRSEEGILRRSGRMLHLCRVAAPPA